MKYFLGEFVAASEHVNGVEADRLSVICKLQAQTYLQTSIPPPQCLRQRGWLACTRLFACCG